MNNKNGVSVISNAVSWVLTAVQTNEIMQIVMLVLSCLATAVSLAYTLYKWYKEANKDGKITSEEISDAVDKTADAFDEIAKKVETYQEGKSTDDNEGNSTEDK